jgi:hypothetical protein
MNHTPLNLCVTLDTLQTAGACTEGYRKLLKHIGGVSYGRSTPIPLAVVLKSNGLDDALWCLRATVEPCDTFARLLACDFAEAALHIFESESPGDMRPRVAIEVARRFAVGDATEAERAAAGDAAWAAAGDAAWAAARTAARTAAWAAAGDAAWAAAGAAAGDAAGAAARDAQAVLMSDLLAVHTGVPA